MWSKVCDTHCCSSTRYRSAHRNRGLPRLHSKTQINVNISHTSRFNNQTKQNININVSILVRIACLQWKYVHTVGLCPPLRERPDKPTPTDRSDDHGWWLSQRRLLGGISLLQLHSAESAIEKQKWSSDIIILFKHPYPLQHYSSASCSCLFTKMLQFDKRYYFCLVVVLLTGFSLSISQIAC